MAKARAEGPRLPKAFAPAEPPRLLTPRVATAEQPVLAWERLLAADGSPREDLGALGELVNGYLHSGLGATSRRIGFNEDLIAALTDHDALGDGAFQGSSGNPRRAFAGSLGDALAGASDRG